MSHARKDARLRLLAAARKDPAAFLRETRARAVADLVTVTWSAEYDPQLNLVYVQYDAVSNDPATPFYLVAPVMEYPASGNPFTCAFQCTDPSVDDQQLSGTLIAAGWAPLEQGQAVLVGLFGYVEVGGQLVPFSVDKTIQT